MLKLPKTVEFEHDGVVVARMAFGLTWFMEKPFSAFPKELLDAFKRFRGLVGDKSLRLYSTGTMKRHKPVTARALSMLPAWFGHSAPPSEDYTIEYLDAEPFNSAPLLRFAMTGREEVKGARLESATVVRWTLPKEWGIDRSGEVLELTKEMCELLPFRSGQVGFAFEVSRYFAEKAFEFALPMSMRHPGIDVHNITGLDANAVCFNAVRGVGWLTMLDDAFVKKLGKPALKLAKIHKVKGGIIIQAGDAPATGDVNHKDALPAYREVFAYVRPLVEVAVEQSPWFRLSKDGGDRTEAWYRRFADE